MRWAPRVWKTRCVGLIECWSLKAFSSSKTTSAFLVALCLAVSLVMSCALLLRWPAHSFSSSIYECAGQSGFKCSFLQGNNYFLSGAQMAVLDLPCSSEKAIQFLKCAAKIKIRAACMLWSLLGGGSHASKLEPGSASHKVCCCLLGLGWCMVAAAPLQHLCFGYSSWRLCALLK